MSDSEFVAALRKERQDLVPLAEAPGLPAAREEKRRANEEYQGLLASKRAMAPRVRVPRNTKVTWNARQLPPIGQWPSSSARRSARKVESRK